MVAVTSVRVTRSIRDGRTLQRGVADQHWHVARRLVVGALAGESMIAEVIAVVGGENDDGVVEDALLCQCFDDATDLEVNLRD